VDQVHEGRIEVQKITADSVLSLAVNPVLSYFVTVQVQGAPLCLIVDTGAAVSLLRKDKWALLGGTDKYKLQQWLGGSLVGVEGSPISVCGTTMVEVKFGNLDLCIDFLVVDSLKVESLIGIDFLEKHSCVVNLKERSLQLKGNSIPLQNTKTTQKNRTAQVSVSLLETITIPPYSELETMASAAITKGNSVWLVSGLDSKFPALVAAGVVTCLQDGKSAQIPIRAINPFPSAVTLYKDTKVATAEELDD